MTAPGDEPAGWLVVSAMEPWCLLCKPTKQDVRDEYEPGLTEECYPVAAVTMDGANQRSLRCSGCANFLEESARRFRAKTM